ncbi:hypothetical protein IKE96_02385 [bacterium]|nr:hypothetical protein [bacterium]
MAELFMNADKLITSGEEIKTIASELANVVSVVYNSIGNIPANEAWVSSSENGSANVFVSGVLKNRESAQLLASRLNDLGEAVINYAKDINSCADINI